MEVFSITTWAGLLCKSDCSLKPTSKVPFSLPTLHIPVYRQSYSLRLEAEDTPRTRSQPVETEEDSRMSRRTRRRPPDKDTPDVEEDVQEFKRSRRGCRSLYGSAEADRSGPVEGELRRSSRRKKPIYSTMDQTLLGKVQCGIYFEIETPKTPREVIFVFVTH